MSSQEDIGVRATADAATCSREPGLASRPGPSGFDQAQDGALFIAHDTDGFEIGVGTKHELEALAADGLLPGFSHLEPVA